MQADESPRWLARLNPDQREAVMGRGAPTCVVAGAGTGKTSTISARVASLVADGVAPERIVLLTFARRAAAEMIARAAQMSAAPEARRVVGGTFHSVAARVLRRFHDHVGLDDTFGVLDQGDAQDLIAIARARLGHSVTTGRARRFPTKSTLLAIYSHVVNSQRPLAEVLDEQFGWCRQHAEAIAAIFDDYVASKRSQQMLDFDDMLIYWRALCGTDAVVALRADWDHLLVDEYQDCNSLQSDIVDRLCDGSPQSPELFAVGDDAQAIYGFRAATSRHMLEFADRHPRARLCRLETNYRSTQPICDTANALMVAATDVVPKTLRSARDNTNGMSAHPRPVLVACADETAQSDYVIDSVLEARERGAMLRDQAVLFRTAHHADGLEIALNRRDIPYVKFGGLRFLDRAAIKDTLAALRILENPRDELAWTRVLSLLPGVGVKTADRIVGELAGAADPLVRWLTRPPDLPADAVEHADALRAAMRECVIGPNDVAHGSDLPPGSQIEALRPVLTTLFELNYPNPEPRIADIDTLVEFAARSLSRAEFLAELALDPPASTSDLAGPPHLDDDYLTLSTIHSAKGGEFDHVYVLHVSDGCIPSDMATSSPESIEEERRLLYVAVTRARERLHLTYPMRFYHQRRRPRTGAHTLSLPSRFITAEVAATLDQVDHTPSSGPSDKAVANSGASVAADVDIALTSLWH